MILMLLMLTCRSPVTASINEVLANRHRGSNLARVCADRGIQDLLVTGNGVQVVSDDMAAMLLNAVFVRFAACSWVLAAAVGAHSLRCAIQGGRVPVRRK